MDHAGQFNSGGQPIRFTDDMGLAPGDRFATRRSAVLDLMEWSMSMKGAVPVMPPKQLRPTRGESYWTYDVEPSRIADRAPWEYVPADPSCLSSPRPEERAVPALDAPQQDVAPSSPPLLLRLARYPVCVFLGDLEAASSGDLVAAGGVVGNGLLDPLNKRAFSKGAVVVPVLGTFVATGSVAYGLYTCRI